MRNMEKKERVWRVVLLFFLSIAIPTLIESIYLYLNPAEYGGGYSILKTMPSISDEVWYYNQIKSMISYGRPLGYYGYDGRHAMIRTFVACGWFILLPHFIVCKLFGLHLYSGTIINIILFAILIFLQGYHFRQAWLESVSFGILLFAPFTLFYFDGWLMEGVIAFWGTLSAIMMAYIDKAGLNKKNTVLLCLVVVFAAMSKVTWSILVIPVVIILGDKLHSNKISWIKKAGKIVLIFILAVLMFLLFYTMFSAPYFAGDYGIDKVSKIIRSEGLLSGIYFLGVNLCHNLGSTFLINESALYTLCSSYIVFAFAISMLWIYFSRKDLGKALIPVLVLGGFMVGVTMLYGGGIGAVKTITPAVTFVLVYIYIHDNTAMKRIIICGSMIFLCSSFRYQYSVGDLYTSIHTEEKKISLLQIQEHMNCITVDLETNNPWDNTVAFTIYGGNPGDDVILLLPAGVGIMLYRTLPAVSEMQEKYVFLTQTNIDRKSDFLAGGYYVLDEFAGNTLLCRQSVDYTDGIEIK